MGHHNYTIPVLNLLYNPVNSLDSLNVASGWFEHVLIIWQVISFFLSVSLLNFLTWTFLWGICPKNARAPGGEAGQMMKTVNQWTQLPRRRKQPLLMCFLKSRNRLHFKKKSVYICCCVNVFFMFCVFELKKKMCILVKNRQLSFYIHLSKENLF